MLRDNCTVTQSMLSGDFVTRSGMPLARYLRRQRIEAACADLLSHEDDLEAIAERYGFCDRYHFSRIFRAEIGLPPITWRRQQSAATE